MRHFIRASLYPSLVLLITLAFTACSDRQKPAEPSGNRPAVSGTFVIALLPEENVFQQKRRYIPLVKYLSRRLGMDVRTKLLDDYDALYTEMVGHKVDAAFFGGFSYLAMDSLVRLDSIARPVQLNGVSTSKRVIFSRRNRGITGDAGTWKGKRIALVSKYSTSGYIFPEWYLLKSGIRDFEGHFRKVIYTGSHIASILAVLDNKADIGCVKASILIEFLDENPSFRDKLVVLASSDPVPENTFGMMESADRELKGRIKEALLGMERTEDGKAVLSALGARGFKETNELEFRHLLTMIKDLGLQFDQIALDALEGPQMPALPGKEKGN